MDTTNDFNLKDGFRYISETYYLALCELTLGKLMFEDYDANEQLGKAVKIIIIDALFSLAAINTHKLLDISKGAFNIQKLVNKCNLETKEHNGDILRPIKIKYDKVRFQRIEDRRNKSLVHPDFTNIIGNIAEDYPLYIEDIQITLESLAPIIADLSLRIDGSCIGEIKNRSSEGKEYYFSLKDSVEKQYQSYRNEHILFEKMFAYLREKNLYDLFRMTYLQEGTTSGQA